MGLYIKGIGMPQNCQSCNFYNGLGCKATGRMFAMLYNVATRRNDCPLIEVPEPHGRLIDADIMKTKIEGNDPIIPTLLEWIDQQPTIIEAEETE